LGRRERTGTRSGSVGRRPEKKINKSCRERQTDPIMTPAIQSGSGGLFPPLLSVREEGAAVL
jgi:hypothetical protein